MCCCDFVALGTAARDPLPLASTKKHNMLLLRLATAVRRH